MMKKYVVMMCMTALMVGCNTAADVEQQVDELYSKMSKEERIAQLKSMFMDNLFDEQGQLDTAKCRQLIPNGIGHFSQYASQKSLDPNVLRDRVAAVQDWLMHHTPNGIPALFHEEVLSGINTRGATIYPQQIGQACSFNPELAELKTRQTSTARRKMGGVLSLSPMVDVCRTPSFNRLEESYGEDAYLSAVMGTAFVRGLQQGDLKKGVGACSKHYLGYGGGGDADEIVQIYLSLAENSSLKLQGFARVSLQPDKTKTLRVKLYTDQLGYYTNNGHRQWNIAPGTFVVKIGASSTDIRLQDQVVLRGKPVSKPLRDHYFSDVTIK